MVAADAPTGFQRVQPLLQAADDVVSDLVSALAMSSSFCARAATLEMRAISPLPVSTSSSSNWTLLRR